MAASRSRSVPDSYHFTVVYDGCLSGDDKTDSTKLSYEFAEKLQEKAEKRGILCFLPHQMIDLGKLDMRELYSAVQNSDHVILVMTEGYLGKMCSKKQRDSQNDPDWMLQQIHYNIIDYKISDNADGVIVVPIYLQTRKKEISLGAYRSIQFRKKEDWEDEENWEKIWKLIPKGLQPSVLTGSAVSSPGSSVPDAGKSAQNDSNQGVRSQEPAAAAAVRETVTETAENPQESMQFESLTSDARVSAEETAGSSTADSKTDARQRSESIDNENRGSRDHHPGSPPCANMDSSPSGARNLQPSALTGSAVSSPESSEPDAGESEASAALTGSAVSSPGSSEPDVGESEASAVLTGSAVSSPGSSEPDAGESVQSGVRSQEIAAVSETATDAVSSLTENLSKMSSSETTENPQDSTQVESLILGTKSSDEKTENEGAASGISRSQSEPACSQQQQEKKLSKEKTSGCMVQ